MTELWASQLLPVWNRTCWKPRRRYSFRGHPLLVTSAVNKLQTEELYTVGQFSLCWLEDNTLVTVKLKNWAPPVLQQKNAVLQALTFQSVFKTTMDSGHKIMRFAYNTALHWHHVGGKGKVKLKQGKLVTPSVLSYTTTKHQRTHFKRYKAPTDFSALNQSTTHKSSTTTTAWTHICF